MYQCIEKSIIHFGYINIIVKLNFYNMGESGSYKKLFVLDYYNMTQHDEKYKTVIVYLRSLKSLLPTK